MMFQALEYKGRNFLKLLDDEGCFTSPTYTRGGAWLKHFSHKSHYEPCCYELKLLELSNRTTLILSNTRELDRELFYKLVYLI